LISQPPAFNQPVYIFLPVELMVGHNQQSGQIYRPDYPIEIKNYDYNGATNRVKYSQQYKADYYTPR
jgi:hypothetical protein